MARILIAVVSIAFLSSLGPVTTSSYQDAVDQSVTSIPAEISEEQKAEEAEGAICHLPSSPHAIVQAMSGASQEPVQPSQDGQKACERPSKNNPDIGGKDPKKVGCKCARTCQNGSIVENTEEGKRCKNHCFKDRCSCPDPCKS